MEGVTLRPRESELEEQLAKVEKSMMRDPQALIAAGFFRTSNRYRRVARVPGGKTALEALREQSPKAAAELEQQLERWARQRLLCGPYQVEELILTSDEFAAFKKAGGEIA